VIIMNVLSMGLEHYGQSDSFTFALELLNYLFTGIFTVEMAIKMIGLGCGRYFVDNWNKFDFFIVLVSYVGIGLDLFSSDLPLSPSILRIMRIFRMVRILKLLKTAQGVRALLDCVFQSIGQIANMCSLLFIFFVVFAAAGVELFGRLGCNLGPCSGISEHANFSNFGMALLALFRICTGDNGNGILKDAMRTSPDCDDSEKCLVDCCSSVWIAPAYFMSFTVLAQFVLLNVAIAVLMAQLEESQETALEDALEQQHLQELSEADAKVVSERCEVAEPLGDSAMQVEV